MTKSIYYEISFIALHQKKPADLPSAGNSPNLFIGGIDTGQDKYGLEFGFGDPGENPNADFFDYPEFKISGVFQSRPEDYSASGTYQREGSSPTTTYKRFWSLTVPDDFVTPSDLDIIGGVTFAVPAFWNLSLGSATISTQGVSWKPADPSSLISQSVDAGLSLVKNYGDQYFLGDIISSTTRAKSVFDGLYAIHTSSLSALDTLLKHGDTMSASDIEYLTDKTLAGAEHTALATFRKVSGLDSSNILGSTFNSAADILYSAQTNTYTFNGIKISYGDLLSATVKVSIGVGRGGDPNIGLAQVVTGNIAGATVNTGSGDDVVLLTGGNNGVTTGAGDDRIAFAPGAAYGYVDGSTGHDTVAVGVTRGEAVTTIDSESIQVDVAQVGGAAIRQYLYTKNIEDIKFIDGRLTVDVEDNAAKTLRLYGAAFGRNPDVTGQNFWSNALDHGVGLDEIASGFVASVEFQSSYYGLSNGDLVAKLYDNVLHRAPDPGGAAFWTRALQQGASRAEVLLGFSESIENINGTTPYVKLGVWVLDSEAAQVARLYDTSFERHADRAGLEFWTHALRSGASLHDVAAEFVNGPEFLARFGTPSNAEFVREMYVHALHRLPDGGGSAFWTAALDGGVSRADVVLGFSESPEHVANTAGFIQGGILL